MRNAKGSPAGRRKLGRKKGGKEKEKKEEEKEKEVRKVGDLCQSSVPSPLQTE